MSAPSLKILCRYEYDPLDRLTGAGLVANNPTRRFYQGDHLVNELEQQDRRTILRHQAKPLAQQHSESGVMETELLVTDHAHSLLQTGSSKNLQKFSYSAFGYHPTESGSSRRHSFNGEYPDNVTGHYPLGQGRRFYNPLLMRFNRPDELSPFEKGGINAYAYCSNDPINFFDPTGGSLVALFRPWNFTGLASGLDLTKVKQTATTITRNRLASRYPLLTALLDEPIMGRSARVPRVQAQASDLVSLPEHLPSDMARVIPESDLSRKTVELRNFEASYDLNKSNNQFKTVATRKQITKLSNLRDELRGAETGDAKRRYGLEIIKQQLKIKKTSVEKYYVQRALGYRGH